MLGGGIVALVMAEGVFRIADVIPVYEFSPGIYQSDRGLGFTLKKNYSGSQGNIPIFTDSAGFRVGPAQTNQPLDTNWSKSKQLHLIFVGDSHTFGSGVNFSSTFPAQTCSILTSDLKTKTTFRNLGVPGYSTDQEVGLLIREWEQIQPDAVILQIYENDYLHDIYKVNYDGRLVPAHESARKTNYFRQIRKLLYFNSQTYRFLRHNLKQMILYLNNGKQTNRLSSEKKWDHSMLALKRLISHSKENETPLLICFFSNIAELESFFIEESITVLNVEKLWKSQKHRLPYDPHPNTKGHQRIAHEIASKIMDSFLE